MTINLNPLNKDIKKDPQKKDSKLKSAKTHNDKNAKYFVKKASDFLQENQKKLNNSYKSCKKSIKANPLKSAAMAVLGGALAITLLRNIFKK